MDYLLGAVLCVGIAVVVVAARTFIVNENALRIIKAIPQILDAVELFVKRAEVLSDQIKLEYAEDAVNSQMDARLLWAIDQIEDYAKSQFKVDLDINWLIAKIEEQVKKMKEG